jgi:membrane protease YdiL (CAAX protease family)
LNVIPPTQAGHSRIWRFVQFPLTRIVVAMAFMIVVILLLQIVAALTHFKPGLGLGALVAVALTAAALIATYVVYVRLIERRHATELGARGAALEFAIGFMIGGFLFCLIMLILWLAGVTRIGYGAGWIAIWMPLLIALELGVLQAILLYGILFRIVEGSLGTWIALALTVVVLGCAHAGGPGAGLISEVTIGLEAGTLIAAVYVYSRRLWMAIGLLTAWNFTEGGVFGVSFPGHTESGLLVSQFHGPQVLTGGAAGPEVTIVALLVCLTAAVLFFRSAFRKGRIINPFWRRSSPRCAAATQ